MDVRAIFLGLAFALMWSSAFTSARIIVFYAPPLYSLSARFLISGLIGVIIALMLGQSWKLSNKQWISVAVFGVCQNALYLGLNFIAMQTVEASLAAMAEQASERVDMYVYSAQVKAAVEAKDDPSVTISFKDVAAIEQAKTQKAAEIKEKIEKNLPEDDSGLGNGDSYSEIVVPEDSQDLILQDQH